MVKSPIVMLQLLPSFHDLGDFLECERRVTLPMVIIRGIHTHIHRLEVRRMFQVTM